MDKQPVYPGIKQAVRLMLLLLLVQVAGGLGIGMLALEPGLAFLRENRLVDCLLTLASFFIVLHIGHKKTNLLFHETFPLSPFPLKLMLPIAIMIFGISVAASELDNVARFFFPPPKELDAFLRGMYKGGFFSMVLLAAVAPITEELFFRGLILNGLLSRYETKKAVLVSAALFAVIHINPYQFPSGFLAGLLLAWLFVRTKSLWTCIMAHSFFNLIPFIMIRVLELNIPGYSNPELIFEQGRFQPLWFDILGLGLVWTGYGMILKMTEPGNQRMKNTDA